MGKIREIFLGPKLTVPETYPSTPESEAIVAKVEKRVAQSIARTAILKKTNRPFWRREGIPISSPEGGFDRGFSAAESYEEARASVEEMLANISTKQVIEPIEEV